MQIEDLRMRLTSARKAVADARWDAALEILTGCEDWPIAVGEHAVLVKADALTRRDAAAALAWLAATQDITDSDEARFQRELLTGRAYANVRNFSAAAARFERARKLIPNVTNGEPRLAYHTARLRWFRRESHIDDADIAIAIGDPNPEGSAAGYLIRAWVHTANGDYTSQIADFETALGLYETVSDECDVASVAITVHSLARVSFETGNQDGVAVARRAHEWLRWSDGVRVDHFQTLRALGWDAFMRGEAVRAQWLFRDAASVAPTPAWQALAHLDRSYVARISGNEPWALDELSEALRLARGVAWGATNGEERLALVTLADLLAPVDSAEAQRYAAIYSMIGTDSVSPTMALSNDRRAIGLERYAFGRVEQMQGNFDSAEAALREAYEIFAPVGYHYRATLASSALNQITGDPEWLAKTQKHLEHYPGCPINTSPMFARPQAESALDGLTPLQQRIARAHWSGLDAEELSQRFSRSVYTIQQHLETTYAAFGVRSKTGLRDEALRRGLN